MKQKWIFTGAVFALAMTLTGCRDNTAASIPQPGSQEQSAQASGTQTEVVDSTVPATAQTSGSASAQAQTSAPAAA